MNRMNMNKWGEEDYAHIYNMTGHDIDICDEDRRHLMKIRTCGLTIRAGEADEAEDTLKCEIIGQSDLDLPLWRVAFKEPQFYENSVYIQYEKPSKQEIYIITSKISATQLLEYRNSIIRNPIWDWVKDSVRIINLVVPHKTQRDGNKIYGALGLSLIGQIGR